jgi:hypothetical protein
VAQGLGQDEIAIFDAGYDLQQLFEAKIRRFVVRLAKNFKVRRNFVVPNAKGRRRKCAARVRPLARRYKTKPIAATARTASKPGALKTSNFGLNSGTTWFSQVARPAQTTSSSTWWLSTTYATKNPSCWPAPSS